MSCQDSPEPHGLLGILASFFSGVSVGLFLSKPRTPIQQPIDAHSAQDNTNDERRTRAYVPPAPVRVLVESLPPPKTSPEEREAEKKRERRPQWWILLVNVLTLIAVITYACITRKMWIEMQTQTQTARQQLELSERPWIKIVDVRTIGNDPFIPALSFQGFGHGSFPKGNKQATFQLVISMDNIGHSLAFVEPDFELFFPPWKGDFEDLILSEEHKFCDASARRSNKPVSRVVFPREPIEWHGAANQLAGPMLGPNALNEDPDGRPGDYVLPIVIVCANYTFRASPKKYQTRAMYVVVHKATGNRFFKIGEDIPERELRIIRDEMADDAY